MTGECEVIIQEDMRMDLYHSSSQFTPVQPGLISNEGRRQETDTDTTGTLKYMVTPRSITLLEIEAEREEDGRWIAEIPQIPGALAYGASRGDAISKVEALALRVIADEIEQDGNIGPLTPLFFIRDA